MVGMIELCGKVGVNGCLPLNEHNFYKYIKSEISWN